MLGSNAPGSTPEFDGDLAEFAAYGADLTDDQIHDLYVGYWQPRFNLPPIPRVAARRVRAGGGDLCGNPIGHLIDDRRSLDPVHDRREHTHLDGGHGLLRADRGGGEDDHQGDRLQDRRA